MAAPVAPDEKLRAWVDSRYNHITLREKDTGTKLEALYAAYTACMPPVHMSILGRNKFAAMLNKVHPGIGPHRNTKNTITSIYLVRAGT